MMGDLTMTKKEIIAKLDGVVMGTELIDVTQTFDETINDKRFTEAEKQSCYNYGFMVWRQRLLRDGGLSPDEKKKYRQDRQRLNVTQDLGFGSWDEMVDAIKKTKELSV